MEPGSRGEVKRAAPESLLAGRGLPRVARGQGEGMLWLIGAAVVVMGAILAIQPLLNARIAHAAGHAVYGAMFSPPYPARSTVEIGRLPDGMLLEIECTALLEREQQ